MNTKKWRSNSLSLSKINGYTKCIAITGKHALDALSWYWFTAVRFLNSITLELISSISYSLKALKLCIGKL